MAIWVHSSCGPPTYINFQAWLIKPPSHAIWCFPFLLVGWEGHSGSWSDPNCLGSHGLKMAELTSAWVPKWLRRAKVCGLDESARFILEILGSFWRKKWTPTVVESLNVSFLKTVLNTKWREVMRKELCEERIFELNLKEEGKRQPKLPSCQMIRGWY